MNEIYWITRLDSINALGFVLAMLGIVGTIVLSVIHILASNDGETSLVKTIKPFRNFSYVILVIGAMIGIFLPTTKEAVMIWGIGGTIDYIKSNETAKQLPDKCIQALDKFVDEYMLNEENNKEE